jgi:hypothetical protein
MKKIKVIESNTISKSIKNPYDLNSYSKSVRSINTNIVYSASDNISSKNSTSSRHLHLSKTLK